MQPAAINLLAANGILRVQFAAALNSDQALAVLAATEAAKTVDELAASLRDLGAIWGVVVVTEIVSRKNSSGGQPASKRAGEH